MTATTPPDVHPQPHWRNIELPVNIASGRSIFTQKPDPRLRLKLFHDSKDDSLVGKAWFGAETYGPPSYVHGGITAFVFDEAMGASAWMHNYPVVARQISVRYIKPTPVCRDYDIRAKIVRIEGREIHTKAWLSEDGQPYTEADGLFVILDRRRFDIIFAGLDFNLDKYPLKWFQK